MHWTTALAAAVLAAAARPAHALLRFSCSQLVVDRIDPLVNPDQAPSPHLHQIVGGNALNLTMDRTGRIPEQATCTTCTFADDFSNYWTAVLYFRARNGTFRRVPQLGNVFFEQARQGGMSIYYIPTIGSMPSAGAVTAFKPGFRMLVGNPNFRTQQEASQFRQLTYTCMRNPNDRSGETMHFPRQPCRAGIMANVRFPTCWDGKNLDSPDHMSHVSYPAGGTFERNSPCPATHPVKIPQLFYETVWDTRPFNNRADWPEDGSQPFVWSFGDPTGFGTHADYVFGWKGDALQKAMDSNCVSCPQLKSQTIQQGNQCVKERIVKEDIDGWETAASVPTRTRKSQFTTATKDDTRRVEEGTEGIPIIKFSKYVTSVWQWE
ncbi:uncharacterized protein E0L32_011327 [Thyridium curvatum]|uniref:DUF1996 domain-containing protein n=1 Tax=Thyridium curvatum TaxID=1093900 RepID=A0A507BQC7_9PEZI|nr:uncharacterized protein E0L32_011327 [Thyridium curvatum]TPX19010.1 hypothetical protein E0L32_011327 [Thyridium curvatum]